jgi:hypothetical protein
VVQDTCSPEPDLFLLPTKKRAEIDRIGALGGEINGTYLFLLGF